MVRSRICAGASVLLLVSLCVFTFHIRLVRAATIIVPDDYSTIQEAIDGANDGDTIFVRNGIYTENIVINKSISLTGENQYSTIIHWNNSPPYSPDAVLVSADNVTIGNLTVEECVWNYGAGIFIRDSVNVRVESVYSKRNHYGVRLYNSNRTTIADNNITDNFDGGIILEYSANSTISNNTVTNNFNGIGLFTTYHSVVVSGNNITGNEHSGVILWGNNILSGNIIANNGDREVYVVWKNNSISDNKISKGYFGIVFGMSAVGNVVFGNTITDCYGAAISLEEIPSNNSIYHNNFINNVQQVQPSGINIWDSRSEGNYWSDYASSDSDGDGIADAPYVIDGGNVDHYPLMNPYWIPADVNHDLQVDILDVVRISAAYGAIPSDPNWNPHADIAEPYGKIDILDVVLCTSHYGKKYA